MSQFKGNNAVKKPSLLLTAFLMAASFLPTPQAYAETNSNQHTQNIPHLTKAKPTTYQFKPYKFRPYYKFSRTEIILFYGNDYNVTDNKRATLRFEHLSTWEFGDNFFFINITNPTEPGTSYYGEWNPRLSLGKMSGKKLALGPITDVLLSGELNCGNNFRARLYGLAVNIDLPLPSSFFTINVYVRDTGGVHGKTWQVTPVWDIPFHIGPFHFVFKGYADIAGHEGNTHSNVLINPEILLDIGRAFHVKDRLFFGFRYFYWKHKFGIKGITDSVLEPQIKWTIAKF